jgi:hypothetical protein
MGVGYREVHEETKRDVAIKVLSEPWTSPLGPERLVQEHRVIDAANLLDGRHAQRYQLY